MNDLMTRLTIVFYGSTTMGLGFQITGKWWWVGKTFIILGALIVLSEALSVAIHLIKQKWFMPEVTETKATHFKTPKQPEHLFPFSLSDFVMKASVNNEIARILNEAATKAKKKP